jgi:hypothetical protein
MLKQSLSKPKTVSLMYYIIKINLHKTDDFLNHGLEYLLSEGPTGGHGHRRMWHNGPWVGLGHTEEDGVPREAYRDGTRLSC